MNIVVVSPSGAAAGEAEELAMGSGDTVHFVCWGTPRTSAMSDAVRIVAVPRPDRGTAVMRLLGTLGRSAPGRNLIRLTPLDTGRDFAKRAARVAEVRQVLRRADIVVAAERDAIIAVWRGGRALAPTAAHLVYGLSAARSLVASTS
jgi:hypothetical protein